MALVIPKRFSSRKKSREEIKLIFARELWSLGEGWNRECWRWVLAMRRPVGISVAITLNFTSREIWSVLVIADCTQRRCVQQYAVIQMHHEQQACLGATAC